MNNLLTWPKLTVAAVVIFAAFYAVGLVVNRSVDETKPLPDLPEPAQSKAAAKFTDPAPPAVNPTASAPAPEPTSHPRVIFHAEPKQLAEQAVTSDWPTFLGPNRNAVSAETPLLKQWPEGGPAVVWEMQKGSGYSTPVVQGDYLVFLHRLGNEGIVECLRPETGEAYWDFRYATQYRDRYGYNNGPRSSPIIDGEQVYVYTAQAVLYCLHLKTGEVRWQRDLAKELKIPPNFFGTSTTPLVEDDLLILNAGGEGGPTVAAFDKLNGNLVWGAGQEWGASYSSPVTATVHGKRRLFVFAGGESNPPVGGLVVLDPATGVVDFEFPWRSRKFESCNASCPLVIGDKVFISANYRTGSTLIQMSDSMQPQQLWTNHDLGTHWNTAVHKDGYYYGFDGHFESDSALVCLDAKTGKTVWREEPEWHETLVINGVERDLTLSTFRACLLEVDDGFLCLGEYGHLMWIDLSPSGHSIKERAWLFYARQTWGLPVLSRGLLYVVQNMADTQFRHKPPRLICYDLRGE